MDLQHLVNHDFIVLDASDSMRPHRESLIKVIDGHVEFLARRSKELGQETRLSVYMFSNPSNVKNIVWDIDVLRMPSVRNIYKTGGMTALLDATHLAIDDLKTIPTKYGDHAFFGSIWTDGMENCSRNSSPINLKNKIDSCPDNWTVAAFVPNISAKHSAKTAGIPTDNIQIWDAVNPAGVAEVGRQLERASEVFFQGRTRGVRGYRSGLFNLNTVSTDQIKRNLTAVPSNMYTILDVQPDHNIYFADKVLSGKFIEAHFGQFEQGNMYYELKMKNERIQASKGIAFLLNGELYSGPKARQMLGLPDSETLVSAEDFPGYRIFVQSKSPVRNLIKGQTVLYLHGSPRARVHGF